MKPVFVGLSGGVDSSVAAALLQREGYAVTGVYMKNWSQDLSGVPCPWREDLSDARAVAAHLDIPFKVYDFETEYRERVVRYLVDEYRSGRTPNPDIICNQEIKFKLFLETALGDGAEMIATGHYAQISNRQLQRSADENKDQSYFLYRVSATALAKTRFPVGGYTKPAVRALAQEFGLPTATKKDSQGICFVGPVGMKSFLQQYAQTEPGPIVQNGREIGTHDGALFFTVGQRQGLGVGGGKPFYVLGKGMATNTVYVTEDPADLDLQSDSVPLGDTYWIGRTPIVGARYQVRFRHRGELFGCEFEQNNVLRLDVCANALATGQSAVLYDGQTCLGGGIIEAQLAPLRQHA